MDIPHSLCPPAGWLGLSEFLGALGISISASAAETRARRHGLPGQGRGPRGRLVQFSRDDVDVWVRHLTGVSFDVWRQRREGVPATSESRRTLSPRRVRRPATLPVIQFPVPLFVGTERTGTSEERVLRFRDGAAAVALDSDALSMLDPEEAEPRIAYWRFSRAAVASAADLHVPGAAYRARRRRPPSRLIGAVVPGKVSWSWVYVPGRWLGATAAGARTIFLSNRDAPGFAEAIDSIRRDIRGATFVTWSDRVEVCPTTLDPIEY